jgi:hypothetical protein
MKNRLKKFLLIKSAEKTLRYLGNGLILFGLFYVHIQYRNYREQIESHIKIAKKELVDNLNLLSEEEFNNTAIESRKVAKKEFFDRLFNKHN